MEAASAIATQAAQTRNELAIIGIKQQANADKQIADLLQSAASSVPGSPIKGTNVNIKA